MDGYDLCRNSQRGCNICVVESFLQSLKLPFFFFYHFIIISGNFSMKVSKDAYYF